MFALRSSVLLRSALAQLHSEFSGCKRWNSNYYATLGLPQNATQADIKAAYYKLSKDYHPDRNQGSMTAADKFRQISQAYEVLGNLRLRKLYDKGIIYTAGAQYAHHAKTMDTEDMAAADVEDDAETKFYKSRFRKSTVGDSTGRTPIYDYDEWSRAHYGKSFDRRQAAKNKFESQQARDKLHTTSVQNEIVIALMLGSLVVMYITFAMESAHDTPVERTKREREAAEKLKDTK